MHPSEADNGKSVVVYIVPSGKVSKPLTAALEAAFGVRDPEAPPVLIDRVQVPHKELEDFENVPLGQSVDEYLAAVSIGTQDGFIHEYDPKGALRQSCRWLVDPDARVQLAIETDRPIRGAWGNVTGFYTLAAELVSFQLRSPAGRRRRP